MNHIYRLIWNAAAKLWVVAAENAKGHGKGGACGCGTAMEACGFTLNNACKAALLMLAVGAQQARAADAANATVSAGAASVATAGNTTTIHQTSQRAAIDWTGLSTRANEALVFNQPNAQAIALNRITGSSPSELLGSLTANGQVFILNPNGVLFGAGSQINVGGLVASTLSMSNADFMAGNNVFSNNGSSASVVNQGTLNAGQGGYLALLAPEVRNEGVMTASLGTALLAAGNKVTLNIDNGSLLGYSIDQGAINALAENKHLIQANGGQVLLSAKAMDSLTTATVNNTGVIEARTIQNKAGRILLMGDMATGIVNVAGTLDASAPNGGDGGFVETSAAHVNVADGTHVTTKATGGKTGTWLIDPGDFTIYPGDRESQVGINAKTLSANLEENDVKIYTYNVGTQPGDIHVNAAVTWGANTTLTMEAINNINFNFAVTATGANAGLVLNYGGDYIARAPVTLSGANASLTMNGRAYTLLHSMSQLQNIASMGLSGYYAMAQDLDAGGTTYTQALVGTAGAAFNGTFTGMGHTLSNLSINSGSNNTGLFGVTGAAGVVRDIRLAGAKVNSSGESTGTLVGVNGGKVINATASGTVSGGQYLGGLVGYNQGTLSNVSASTTVYAPGAWHTGGLVGLNSGGISQSFATGAVTGQENVGGLVGFNFNGGTIRDSYAEGNVNGNIAVGGLAGRNASEIKTSYASGDAAGGISVGGLVGGNNAGGVLDYVYALGGASASTTDAGGLVGSNAGAISNGYATGKVSGAGPRGGVAGNNSGNISNFYWDSDTTTLATGVGQNSGTVTDVTSVNASNRYKRFSYDHFANWQVAVSGWRETVGGSGVWVFWNEDFGNLWVMMDGWTRPMLYSEYTTNVHNAHQLQLMGVNTKTNYTLANDIDASATSGANASGVWSSAGFVPVANTLSEYLGRFDGLGHVIDGLTMNRPGQDNVALFGQLGNNSDVRNVGLINVNITGKANVGALVGNNMSNISFSYVSGNVSGSSNVGGLVGGSSYNVRNSYSSANVRSSGAGGGLVGYSSGSISDSYATGDIRAGTAGGLVGMSINSVTNSYATGSATTGSAYAGGLVGNNRGNISNSYATGKVTGAANSEVGGLAGLNKFEALISNSYATGDVAGSSAGGLVGYNGARIVNSYATGGVNGINGTAGIDSYAGGLVGENNGSIASSYSRGRVTDADKGKGKVGGLVGSTSGGSVANSFWDIETSGQKTSAGGTGKTSAEMQLAITYQNAGWNIGPLQGSNSTWVMYEGLSAPLLRSLLPRFLVFTPVLIDADAIALQDATLAPAYDGARMTVTSLDDLKIEKKFEAVSSAGDDEDSEVVLNAAAAEQREGGE